MDRKKREESEFQECIEGIIESVEHWKDILENGCNDPFWPDGCNANLVRNHIIYYKRKIETMCEKFGFAIPIEYYIPSPPEVSNYFMANLSQKERVERLRKSGNKLTTQKLFYNDSQLSMF